MEETEENFEEQCSDHDSINDYESQQIEIATEELLRLKIAKERLDELEPPSIPKELKKKNKPDSRQKTARNSRKLAQPYTSVYSTTTAQPFHTSTAAKPKNQTSHRYNKSNTSYSSKIILEKVKPKPKPMLRQPLLLTKKYSYAKESNTPKEKPSTTNSKVILKPSNITYEIYANAFKVSKPIYHQSYRKLPCF
eukprot:TRINITY_DN9916_c0_g1_i23.p1 TRINITY_DN9916_c0_g1~~TRINITY_DN9916_c0_g1_i23.p1  ORF type:complete len:194 (-),score=34.22 TRINITY_DN9916_c0_g1_i23:138-719(-)